MVKVGKKMTREILFKAKRKDNGEWVEGFYFCMVHDDGRHIHHFIMPMGADLNLGTPIEKIQVEIDIKTLCQFTGLTDKNGNKIYENDIIETITFGFDKDHFITSIKFGAKFGMQGFYLENGRSLFYFGQSDLAKIDDSKVIGNIFDNPELIGG